MWERNNGVGDDNILQNQFTAYLLISLRRRKARYLSGKAKRLQYELSLDLQEYLPEIRTEPDMLLGLPMFSQLENQRLRQALERLKARDVYIFLAKVLEDRSYAEIAEELGIGYKAVTAAYSRMVERLKKELGGE